MDERARTVARWIGLWPGVTLASLGLSGCESRPSARAQLGEPERGLTARMQHHFEDSVRARDALVRGDLLGARSAARELTRADAEPGLPRAHLEAIRAAARRMDTARVLGDSAMAFGDVALACGACHREAGAAIEAPEPPLPSGDDVGSQMQHHLWAADRLWEGLALPDDQRFAAGARAMLDAPLYRPTSSTPQTVAPEVRALAERVRGIARDAHAARGGDARARAYGALLGTCSDCHRLVGAGGPAAPER